MINLKSINGKTFDLEKMRGRVVVASFGATWCVPCVLELEALEDIKREYKSQPIEFVWISIDAEEKLSNTLLRHYAKERKMTMPVLRDPTHATFAQFTNRVRVPVVVVFDAQGNVAAPVITGMSDAETYKKRVREKLDSLLANIENNVTKPTVSVR